ncbi:MAG: enterochelin esterase-like enzyme [Crocinitomicaceae bacterium]|jgi:enterochelin esterase-like enzyme
MKITIIYFLLLTSTTFSQNEYNSESNYYTDSIFSNSLNEYRKMNIYLPKGYKEGQSYPVIYAPDGYSIDLYEDDDHKLILDSLINNDLIPPMIYVASFCNNRDAKDLKVFLANGDSVYYTFRNFEYVQYRADESVDSVLHLRFDQHLTYFTEELIPSIENQFMLPDMKENRYFYGVSNGGGFGVNMFFKRPELIATYLCFSTYGSTLEKLAWNESKIYPTIYIEYGNLESPQIYDENERIVAKCKDLKLNCHSNIYQGDHDYLIWIDKFASTLIKIFN